MKTVCKVLGVARSNITVRSRAAVAKPLGRPPQPVADLADEIKAVIGEMPTHGYLGSGLFCGARPRLRGFNLPTTNASIGSESPWSSAANVMLAVLRNGVMMAASPSTCSWPKEVTRKIVGTIADQLCFNAKSSEH